jgi:hypothetical protein
LKGILPSTYPCEESNPPPLLNNMLVWIFTSTCIHVGLNPPPYIEWDITLLLFVAWQVTGRVSSPTHLFVCCKAFLLQSRLLCHFGMTSTSVKC